MEEDTIYRQSTTPMMTFQNLSHSMLLNFLPPGYSGYNVDEEGEPDGPSVYFALFIQTVSDKTQPYKQKKEYLQ
jgi:hypothetical protein